MLSNEPLLGAKHNESTGWLSPKLFSLDAISMSVFRIGCAFILICVLGILGFGAQTPRNIEDDTKDALAREWKDPNGVRPALNALRLLTRSSNPPDVNRQVLQALIDGDGGNPQDQDLYRAAMGDPDVHGRTSVQGLPNFLDILAKANTLKLVKTKDEDGLFASTQTVIDTIYGTGPGKLALIKVNDSFNRKDNYLALFGLLNAYTWNENGDNTTKQKYANDLEKIRAAFEMNTALLASQVAAKITPAKKT
jgi:hypothetical protein